MTPLANMSDDELLRYARSQVPVYRRMLFSLKSFVNGLLGRGKTIAHAANVTTFDINQMGDLRKSGGGITLAQFKAPSFTKLKKHISVLQDSDKIDHLDDLIAMLSKNPSKEFAAEAKRLVPILNSLQELHNTALEILEEVAEKHLPLEVDAVCQEALGTAQSIIRSYSGNAKAELGSTLLVGNEDDRIDFCFYMDATEYVESRTWIIVTCSLSTVGSEYIMSRHVAVLDRFVGPMDYDFGVATTDIRSAIKEALADHDIVAELSKVKLKIDQTKLQNAVARLPFVAKIESDDDELHVWVKGNKRNAQQEKDLFAALTSHDDVRKLLGRTKRLHSVWNEDHWVFSISARS